MAAYMTVAFHACLPLLVFRLKLLIGNIGLLQSVKSLQVRQTSEALQRRDIATLTIRCLSHIKALPCLQYLTCRHVFQRAK